MDTLTTVKKIMTAFAESTGLSNSQEPPRRYLWTDAFAVCNFLELHRRTGDGSWRDLALHLLDQVHNVLGRHRGDDERTGWISGLGEEEGKRHPTMGGLRIGKKMNERRPDDPYDERAEWDRDGQYYHYLTKWMHALNQVSRSMEDPVFNSWGIELAKNAHRAFTYTTPAGSKRMYWKMSIDLSRPLVASMGQHDPLDGWITYQQLRTIALELSDTCSPDLDSEIADMEALCKGQEWITDDPLGIGGILGDAYRILQLITKDGFVIRDLLTILLESSLVGLNACTEGNLFYLPADTRLAFRELGMSIGLHGVKRIAGLVRKRPDLFSRNHPVHGQIDRLGRYAPFSKKIEEFWLDPRNRKSRTWTEHADINGVMLATSLSPDGYLEI